MEIDWQICRGSDQARTLLTLTIQGRSASGRGLDGNFSIRMHRKKLGRAQVLLAGTKHGASTSRSAPEPELTSVMNKSALLNVIQSGTGATSTGQVTQPAR